MASTFTAHPLPRVRAPQFATHRSPSIAISTGMTPRTTNAGSTQTPSGTNTRTPRRSPDRSISAHALVRTRAASSTSNGLSGTPAAAAERIVVCKQEPAQNPAKSTHSAPTRSTVSATRSTAVAGGAPPPSATQQSSSSSPVGRSSRSSRAVIACAHFMPQICNKRPLTMSAHPSGLMSTEIASKPRTQPSASAHGGSADTRRTVARGPARSADLRSLSVSIARSASAILASAGASGDPLSELSIHTAANTLHDGWGTAASASATGLPSAICCETAAIWPSPDSAASSSKRRGADTPPRSNAAHRAATAAASAS